MRKIIAIMLLFCVMNSFSQKISTCRFHYCKNYRVDNLFKEINWQINSDETLEKYDTILTILEYDLFNPTTLFYFGKKNNNTDVKFYSTQNQEHKNYTCLRMTLNSDSIILPSFSKIENLLKDSLFLKERSDFSVSHPTDITIMMKVGKKCIYNNSFQETTLFNDTTDAFLFRQNYKIIMDCIVNGKYESNAIYCRDVVLKKKLLRFKKRGR